MTVRDAIEAYTAWVSRWPDKSPSIEELKYELLTNRALPLDEELGGQHQFEELLLGVRRVVWYIVQDHDSARQISLSIINKANAKSLGVAKDDLDILDI
jgi:hypothetical protein